MSDSESSFPDHLTILSDQVGGRGYANSDLDTEDLRDRIDQLFKDQNGGAKKKKSKKTKSRKATSTRRKSRKMSGGKRKLGEGPQAFMALLKHIYSKLKPKGKSYKESIKEAKRLWDSVAKKNPSLEKKYKERTAAAIKAFDP